ncbi:MAG: helix-turn-helix transcriptional regulator, partial [Ruminiclostridium sp.]|nr:helix-turn-helix transcriptional regulator [Ruminiclostridium sp.]
KLYEEYNIKIKDGYYYMFMDCFSHARTFTDISLIFKILLDKLDKIEYNASFHNDEINNKYIKEMYKFIERNYYQNIGLSEIADHLNITKQYLCNIIKKQFNLTLHDILNNYRIEKAIELLNMDHKIIDISKMVGFTNSTYFSVVFKKIVGIKPSEYRRNNYYEKAGTL